MHRFAAATRLAALACLASGGILTQQAAAEVVVMTRNVYLGADLQPVIGAIASHNQAAMVSASSTAFAQVVASNFAERAGSLANEIQQAQPALIGLQEVSLYRSGPFNNPAAATTVELDYLEMLLGELNARGLHYAAVSVHNLTDAETPSNIFGSPRDIRLTDRDVILARTDLAPSQLTLTNPQAGTFATELTVPISGGGAFAVHRGWNSVDVQADGFDFRFVNAHLEPASVPAVQVAQGNELLALANASSLPVALVGDLNSRADGLSTATYGNLITGGFQDAWTQVHPLLPGFTHGQDLFDPIPDFTRRIDLVLMRGGLIATGAKVVGDDPAGRTPSGIWPSDHAGVVATIVPEPSSIVLAACGVSLLVMAGARRRSRFRDRL